MENEAVSGGGEAAIRGAALRRLKGMGQLLKPVVHIGKDGLSDGLVASVNQALVDHELIKVKFDGHKDEKKALAPDLAQRTRSQMIQRVGNVVVLFRRNPEAAQQKIELPESEAAE
jgi:RNA-binding protein